ncbi:MAG TPA: hypothetical protein VFO58_00665 [Vicinamibacterales bacterium]|nr:hypothetical protein [Vicinamibacterales bacterium]
MLTAQLLFAYGFDSLLSWTHRRAFALGFGPFPIIFSITLFFWFKDDWFYLQFGMVALGFLAKEFLRWTPDGVNTHIFNPSSFPLAVASALLLLTNASETTWGFDVTPRPAPISSPTRMCPSPCSSACTCCSPIRPRRRAPFRGASCSASSTG